MSNVIPLDMSYARLRRVANDAIVAGAALKREHQTALMMNYLLVQKLGGEVRVPQANVDALADKQINLQVAFDRGEQAWVFTALMPDPEEGETLEQQADRHEPEIEAKNVELLANPTPGVTTG